MKEKEVLKPKYAQASIFIIISVIIVGVIALFLVISSDVIPGIGGSKSQANPSAFLDSCLEGKVKEAVKIIGEQGGYIEPVFYKEFKFEKEAFPIKISYLCYTSENYISCINQEPMLFDNIENEIKNYLRQDVENCFTELSSDLEKQGYVVEAKYRNFDVNLISKKIEIDINAELILTKAGETIRKKDFKVVVLSKIYELTEFAQKIINKEVLDCEFDYITYMLLYPKFEIDRTLTQDSSIIYTIDHRDVSERFRFAIRGCVIP
ncbi:MAG: hypothetical protein KKF48_05030 [Nanoarchaeota archaeon]|nr:hypothetical protein [Nanoarchaeota archaeon]MBU1028381.1 hypothetical protein [Nanoarchaeota archaeon]